MCGSSARRYWRDVRLIVAVGASAALSTAAGALAWFATGDCRWLLLCLPILLVFS